MELPDAAHVVRYANSRNLHDDGTVDAAVFRLRPQDSGLSVYWLEYFSDSSKAEQLEQVRRLARLNIRRSGRLVELNVGLTKRYLQDELPSLSFVNRPLAADDLYGADPSHSEITGLPPGNTPHAALIGEMIAECVLSLHPAVTGQQSR